MVYGVLVHKIPIATLLAVFLMEAPFSKVQAFLFMLIFAGMTPLGTFVSNTMGIEEQILQGINAVVIGIFLHISTTILFESGEGHKFNLSKLSAIGLGVLIAYIL
jgi:zinc transporter ZupT